MKKSEYRNKDNIYNTNKLFFFLLFFGLLVIVFVILTSIVIKVSADTEPPANGEWIIEKGEDANLTKNHTMRGNVIVNGTLNVRKTYTYSWLRIPITNTLTNNGTSNLNWAYRSDGYDYYMQRGVSMITISPRKVVLDIIEEHYGRDPTNYVDNHELRMNKGHYEHDRGNVQQITIQEVSQIDRENVDIGDIGTKKNVELLYVILWSPLLEDNGLADMKREMRRIGIE